MPNTDHPTHPQLGRLVGQLLAVAYDFDNDPMSARYGYFTDPKPTMERLCAEAGTTLQAVVADVEARVDAKTAWQLGLRGLAECAR